MQWLNGVGLVKRRVAPAIVITSTDDSNRDLAVAEGGDNRGLPIEWVRFRVLEDSRVFEKSGERGLDEREERTRPATMAVITSADDSNRDLIVARGGDNKGLPIGWVRSRVLEDSGVFEKGGERGLDEREERTRPATAREDEREGDKGGEEGEDGGEERGGEREGRLGFWEREQRREKVDVIDIYGDGERKFTELD